MLRSMYSGISGMKGFQTKLDVIGNNIANVNTVGFKKGRVMFQDILSQTVGGVTRAVEEEVGGVNPKQVGLGASIASIDTIHSQGSAMTTNRPLDLSIDGDGFFAIKTNADQEVPYLTRAGNFSLDAFGQLVTPQGYFVVDSGGEVITIPQEEYSQFEISKTGEIIGVTPEGETEVITELGLVTVTNPGGLKKLGNSLYEITANAIPDGEFDDYTTAMNPDTGTGAIISGQLEMSNVDLTEEFTEMIVAQRGFQANSRIITTSDEILQEVVNLKR
ncbi:MAG: flagellar hook-basal body complex protein [Bacillaceae bacterium]|nr:flagellar hook-basal body complex protein [Bacillaceae bacterium]